MRTMNNYMAQATDFNGNRAIQANTGS